MVDSEKGIMMKAQKYFKIMLIMLLIAAFNQGCSKVRFGTNFKAATKNPTEPTDPKDPKDPGDPPIQRQSCFKEDHTQSLKPLTNELDLLFVTDTSGSLNQERESVANEIDTFIAQLPSGIDTNIGVVLAHGSTSKHSGVLYKSDAGEPLVIKSSLHSRTDMQTYLHEKLTNIVGDRDSDGGEEGLYSLDKLLNVDNLAAASAKGFFRSTAALAIVFISDENDICAVYPSGVTPVFDGDGKEIPAKARDCNGITAASLYSQLTSLKVNMPLILSGIIYTGEGPIPSGGENEIGYGYTDIVDLNKGIFGDLGSMNIAQSLAKIGNLVQAKLIKQTRFNLSRTDFLLDTLYVRVDGVDVSFTHDQQNQSVEIAADDAGSDGSAIVVGYCKNDE
jgi:hypothetical protein